LGWARVEDWATGDRTDPVDAWEEWEAERDLVVQEIIDTICINVAKR
jgi:hypothetical protein